MSQSTQADTSAATTDSVTQAFTATTYEILIDWEDFKAASRSSDHEDRILHQVHAVNLADKQGIDDVGWAKMDDARYTDPATGMPIPPASRENPCDDCTKILTRAGPVDAV